jgi:hypothetical protein
MKECEYLLTFQGIFYLQSQGAPKDSLQGQGIYVVLKVTTMWSFEPAVYIYQFYHPTNRVFSKHASFYNIVLYSTGYGFFYLYKTCAKTKTPLRSKRLLKGHIPKHGLGGWY